VTALPLGRFRATLSPWEDNGRVLLATVPARQVRTLYAAVGDAPAVASGLALVALALASRRTAATARARPWR
jgi:apolipoprotein N-acyltransferase